MVAEPQPAAGDLAHPRQRHVVDDGIADRAHAADPLEQARAHEHAAAGRSGGARAVAADAMERIESGEEVGEGGDQQLLEAGPAAEPRHHRHEVASLMVGGREQAGEDVGLVADVRIREPDPGSAERVRVLDPMLLRPHLPGPPRGEGRRGQDDEAVARVRDGGHPSRDVGGAVPGVVVDQHHAKRGVRLGEQGAECLRQLEGFVPRRHHRDDGVVQARRGKDVGQLRLDPPTAPHDRVDEPERGDRPQHPQHHDDALVADRGDQGKLDRRR